MAKQYAEPGIAGFQGTKRLQSSLKLRHDTSTIRYMGRERLGMRFGISLRSSSYAETREAALPH
jgi:hypothetical protein